MAAMPAYTDSLAFLPGGHAGAHLIDHAGHFMARDTGVVQPRPMTFLHKHVTMTDPTGLHSDPYAIGPGYRNFSFNHFKWSAR